jgi:3-phosphoshikimate 1-carboxyvinyltransferase
MIDIPPHTAVKKVIVPASKSYAQRAILAATLGHSTCTIENCGNSDDVNHIIQIAEQLGSKIERKENTLILHPRQREPKRDLNCGESGLGIRLTTSIASTFGGKFRINGNGSLTKRPMTDFEQFLPKLGVNFKSEEGFIPLQINGNLKGGNLTIDASSSSQFISGLIMSLPLARESSVIHVKNLVSAPYLEMTLALLKDFKIELKNSELEIIQINGNQEYQNPETYIVEGDWSAAAFWVVYGALYSSIEIQGCRENSLQADKAILDVIKMAGGSYEWDHDILKIKPSTLNSFEFDASECPDLFPILATFAAAINGTSIIHGTRRLVNKESNRALAIQKEFSKLGLSIDLQEDMMTIKAQGTLNSATIDSHNDHRIAMACAIAAGLTPNGIKITNPSAINKSYPEFWQTIIGA